MIATAPRMRGNRVRQLVQGNSTSPHVRGMRKEVAAPTKKMLPNQSNFLSFFEMLPGGRERRSVKGISTRAMAATGTLIQKIHLHEALYASDPPMTGPTTLPKVQTPPMMPKYCPRCRIGTRSVMMRSLSRITPPPPTPWMWRSAKTRVKSCATADRTMPIRKSKVLQKRTGMRPRCQTRRRPGLEAHLTLARSSSQSRTLQSRCRRGHETVSITWTRMQSAQIELDRCSGRESGTNRQSNRHRGSIERYHKGQDHDRYQCQPEAAPGFELVLFRPSSLDLVARGCIGWLWRTAQVSIRHDSCVQKPSAYQCV